MAGSTRSREASQAVPDRYTQREQRLLVDQFPTAIADVPVEPRNFAVVGRP